MSASVSPTGSPAPHAPEVVCFGVLSYLQLLVVDEIPAPNGGAPILRAVDSFGEDAAIVASLLPQWGVETRLVASALGADEPGRKVAAELRQLGTRGNIDVEPRIDTVFEISIADRSGARSYYYMRTPEAVATLDRADLGLIDSAGFLYVDWYDGDHILRPMKAAAGFGVPVFINIESEVGNQSLLAKILPFTTVCQVSVDESDDDRNLGEIAEGLLVAGFPNVLVTAGARGCLAADASESYWIRAPKIDVVDANGAGSCFSAGFIYGRSQGWSLEKSARFATAQASLKCGQIGYRTTPVGEAERVANALRVQRRANKGKAPRN